VYGDECARGGGVVASNRTARQDREDGHEAAQRGLAAAAAGSVGSGEISAKTPRGLMTIPPDQRASDFHDDTRLGRRPVVQHIRVATFSHSAGVRASPQFGCRAGATVKGDLEMNAPLFGTVTNCYV